MKESFFKYSFEDLHRFLTARDCNPSAAKNLFRWHYKEKNLTECPDKFAVQTKKQIAEYFDFSLPVLEQAQQSDDHTVKFLFRLNDGSKIESVIIPFRDKYTICLSSQVGCAMKCSFCFTGTQGFKRHLLTEEIVGQFLAAWIWLQENRPEELFRNYAIRNIVFMGQGEPLHNFEAVKKACEIFLDQHGFSLGIQKITISTSGYLPGLQRWVSEMPPVNLALSLHSPFEDKRSQIIPINQKYPLAQIMECIDQIPLAKKQYIIYEYIVIKGFNDSEADAIATAKLLEDRTAILNLIPFNPFPGTQFEKPEVSVIENFKKIAEQNGLPVLVRSTKGDSILAACGQLNTKLV